MPTILVVDDDVSIREFLVELLTEEGYDAEAAANGQEALQKLAASESLPDLILLDLMMPVMSGWQFRIEQLTNPRLAAIPVIAISATTELGKHAQALSVHAHLAKPFQVPALLEAVARHAA